MEKKIWISNLKFASKKSFVLIYIVKIGEEKKI